MGVLAVPPKFSVNVPPVGLPLMVTCWTVLMAAPGAALWSWVGSAAMLSTMRWLKPSAMVAKTVKPPFWESRLLALLARLKKNWLVALLGSEPTLAMAIVPRVLTGVVGAGDGNSFLT